MDKLPKDPAIVVIALIMVLRDCDFYTLSELCYIFCDPPKGLQERLRTAGFEYSETQKQFRPIGFDK